MSNQRMECQSNSKSGVLVSPKLVFYCAVCSVARALKSAVEVSTKQFRQCHRLLWVASQQILYDVCIQLLYVYSYWLPIQQTADVVQIELLDFLGGFPANMVGKALELVINSKILHTGSIRMSGVMQDTSHFTDALALM